MTASLPRDAWYALGGSENLPQGSVCAASLFDQDIALWRGGSGRFHAWDNRCVHRGMRLSFGRVRGDRLLCAYHGWNYDEDGRCCYIPARPDMTPSEKIRTPRHQAMDRDGLLWVRLGGDGAAPPDLSSLNPEGRAFVFVQSFVLPEPAEVLDARLQSAVFPPSAWESAQADSSSWRCQFETREGGTTSVLWTGDGTEETVVYRNESPFPGLRRVTAESSAGREARLFALQPQNDRTTALHLMATAEGAETVARQAAARWGRRLRWFVEQQGAGVQAYRPWLEEEVA